MGYIERLTKRVEPYTVTLQPDWQRNFEPEYKADPKLGADLVLSVEGWLRAHVVFVKMQRETLVAAKPVTKAFSQIAKQIDGVNQDAASNTRLEKRLKYRDEEESLAARAHNVALDWIACGLPTAHAVFSRNEKPNPAWAEMHLLTASKSAIGVSQLKASVSGQQEHFGLGPDMRCQRLSKLNGRLLPNGGTFAYMPDPRQRPNARPEQAARDILAAALRDIYRCTGSSPHVPRDGSQTSPFLRFLEAARKSLPRGYQSDLVSPARRAEIDEKKNGPGTLERFKAKLYHPDCWRT